MSRLVNYASSSAAINSCSCLDVHLSALNPSWLSCKIWYFSLYADKMDVSVLVRNLYIVFANAIGRWLVNTDGSPFLESNVVRLIFQEVGICFSF